MVSVWGQEKMSSIRMTGKKAPVRDEIKLRSSEKQIPDSVVEYFDSVDKYYEVYYYASEGPSFYYSDYYKCWCLSTDPFWVSLWLDMDLNVKYNSNGLVESATYIDENSGDNRLVQFQYNASGYILSIDEYWSPAGTTQWKHIFNTTYFYDSYENWIGTQDYNLQYDVPEVSVQYSARVDSKGRIFYSEHVCPGDDCTFGGKPYKVDYFIWYYSDGRTPNVEMNNNTSINSNNQGGFDLNVNIPTDSISTGSITITFPDGFTLDENNTSLNLSDLFDLVITKQDNSNWLFEIKPKTSKSATLRADDSKAMLHIAYTTDESLETGTYNISVNNILFETPSGDYIPEPAITVPAVLDRSNTGIKQIYSLAPTIHINNQTLYIQDENAEQIAIYSIAGNKLYETTIQKGFNAINIKQFRQEVLVVKGSSGWVKKILSD